MDEELIIEGFSFDLGDKKVSQTFQVNDMADLKDRRANYSNTIRAPYTPKNVAALDMLGVPGNQSRAPFRRLAAIYRVNSVEIISNGYVRINALEDFIEIVIYSGNISLMDRIKGLKINELDFSDLNHFLNPSTFQEGMTKTEGYAYALGDFGIDPPTQTGTVVVERQAPVVFHSTIWDKIFTQAGLTYSGAIFSDPNFLAEVMPPTTGYEIEDSAQTSDPLGDIVLENYTIQETSNEPKSYIKELDIASVSNLVNIELVDDRFIKVNFDGTIRVFFDALYNVQKGSFGIAVIRNGSAVIYRHFDMNTTTDSIEINIVASQGDTISFDLYADNERTDPFLPIYEIDMSVDSEAFFDKLEGGLFIDIQAIMPETTQEAFLKDIMQRYGLIFRSKRNHYEFITIEALSNDRENAENWSDKLKIQGKEEYKIGSYAKNNLLLFNYPEEETPRNYDGSISVDNEHLDYDKDMFTSIFTISDQSGNIGTRPIYAIPLWEGKYDDDGYLEEVDIKETQPRIFKINRIESNIVIRFFETGPSPISGTIATLTLEDVQMDFQVANYFPAFGRMLNAPFVKSDIFYLDLMDIYKLDFFRLKYLEQYGAYFYLNKVENFSPGELTRCEMIRVNGISKGVIDGNQPPIQLGTTKIELAHGSSITLSLSNFTNTTPPYFDPEYDDPEQIKIITFGTNHVKMLHNGVTVTGEIIVDANNFDLKIVDLGQTHQAHSATFDFKIQSYNNPNFSNATGTILANVMERINHAPVADAGMDILITAEPGISGTDYNEDFYLNGCDSYDPDNDPIVYLWELIDAPAGVVLTEDDVCSPLVTVNINNGPDLIKFKAKLTVEDPFGLDDEDIVDITFTNFTNTQYG